MFGLMLIILFAGGSFYQWFPLRGLTSEGWEGFSTWHKVTDYAWHMVLPLTALVIGAFATSTLLTKNSFLDEIRKQYVLTARMKGLSERRVLYGHVFRNAMLIVIAGFPGAFISAFFTGSLLIETIFSLDGLGELSLPGDRRARLSGGVRHALHLLAARARREPALGPDLRLDRPADRLLGAGDLTPADDEPDLSSAARATARRRASAGRAEPDHGLGSAHLGMIRPRAAVSRPGGSPQRPASAARRASDRPSPGAPRSHRRPASRGDPPGCSGRGRRGTPPGPPQARAGAGMAP